MFRSSKRQPGRRISLSAMTRAKYKARYRLTLTWIILAAVLACRFVEGQNVPALEAVRVATGMSQAIFVTAPPGDYNRIFVVRQGGQINVIDLQTGTIETFLDISSGFNLRAGGEQGLLGMAFDPDYNSAGSSGQGKFYLNFTVNGGIWA